MKSLKEALVHKHMDRPKKHRNYWYPENMYTDPEDIIAMFLSRKCLLHDEDGQYFIPLERDVDKIEYYIKNKHYSRVDNSIRFVPVDSFAYEQALDILKEEGWEFEYYNFKLNGVLCWAIFLKD